MGKRPIGFAPPSMTTYIADTTVSLPENFTMYTSQFDPWVKKFPVHVYVEQRWLLAHVRLAAQLWEHTLGFDEGILFTITGRKESADLIIVAGNKYVHQGNIYTLGRNDTNRRLGTAYARMHRDDINCILIHDRQGAYHDVRNSLYFGILLHELGHTPFGLHNNFDDEINIMRGHLVIDYLTEIDIRRALVRLQDLRCAGVAGAPSFLLRGVLQVE